MKIRRIVIALAGLALLAGPCAAQEEDLPLGLPAVSFELQGVKFYGVGLRFLFNEVPGLMDARLSPLLEVGGGRWSEYLFRRSDGSEWVPALDDTGLSLAAYPVWDSQAGLGLYARLRESLLGLNLGLYGVYRFEYSVAAEDAAGTIAADEGLAELDGLFSHQFVAGFQARNVELRRLNQVRSGWLAEISLTGGMADPGDFWGKAGGRFDAFLPIVDGRSIGLYAGARILAEYLAGDGAPAREYQRFGGYDPVTGLGSGLRGTAPGRFDGRFRALANLDLRLSFPGLAGYYVFPGLIAFADAGVSDERSSDLLSSGVQGSVGAGFWAHMFGFDLVLTYAWHINEERPSLGFGMGLAF